MKMTGLMGAVAAAAMVCSVAIGGEVGARRTYGRWSLSVIGGGGI